jgi:hypothetical protein
MRFPEPFLRLPFAFEAARLAAEVAALPGEAWVPHPNAIPGNEAVRLVTTHGGHTDDTLAPMAPTEYLRGSPYIMEVMATIGGVWGRSRLMRLAPGAVVPPHVDTHYYWRTHIRIHVPITTTPDVLFTCARQTIHMAAGECWIFNTFRHHSVRNGSDRSRVHLVLDAVESEPLWQWVDRAGDPPAPALPGPLVFERYDTATTMSPWELRHHVGFIAEEVDPQPLADAVIKRLDRFVAGWNALWMQYGPATEGAGGYRALLAGLDHDLIALRGENLLMRNRIPLYRQIAELVYALETPLPAAQ